MYIVYIITKVMENTVFCSIDLSLTYIMEVLCPREVIMDSISNMDF